MCTRRTLVALATYNEIENLPSLVAEVMRVLPAADVLVIDDNSPDGTGRWCDGQANVQSRLRCLHRPGKLGLGSATLEGMRFALDNGYELFVTMDADWSHDPKHLPALVAATNDADVAVGSRYCLGGGVEGWPLHRRIMSRGMNGMSRLFLRLPIRDSSGAFRAYRVSKLRDLDFSKIRATGYAYVEEIAWHLWRAGATFSEVPITFRERRAGKSKISFREAVSKFSTVARLTFSR